MIWKVFDQSRGQHNVCQNLAKIHTNTQTGTWSMMMIIHEIMDILIWNGIIVGLLSCFIYAAAWLFWLDLTFFTLFVPMCYVRFFLFHYSFFLHPYLLAHPNWREILFNRIIFAIISRNRALFRFFFFLMHRKFVANHYFSQSYACVCVWCRFFILFFLQFKFMTFFFFNWIWNGFKQNVVQHVRNGTNEQKEWSARKSSMEKQT